MRSLYAAIILVVMAVFFPAWAANDITGTPWKIDTAGSSLIVTGDVYITCVKWVSPSSSAADQVVIQNSSSRTIWAEVAPGAQFSSQECFPTPLVFTGGLKVTTLGSGTVYLYAK